MLNRDGKTKVVIIRHGNTFHSGQTPTRVGGKTDIDLVPSGKLQSLALGRHLLNLELIPRAVFSANLRRTLQTAYHLLLAMGLSIPVKIDPLFNEIDYGPDENQPEEKVIERVGKEAIKLWDSQGIPPTGWNVDPLAITHAWKSFLTRCTYTAPGQTVFIVTSNGVARFAPKASISESPIEIKLKTGTFSVFTHNPKGWEISCWNQH